MKTASTTVIELPRLSIQNLNVVLIGKTPLVVHRFSEKAKRQIYEKQTKKADKGQGAKDPRADFEASLYRLSDGRHGFPAIAFKAAAIRACTSLKRKVKMTEARQAFHIVNGVLSIREAAFADAITSDELVPILAGDPAIREDMVRIAMGGTDIRYRGQYWPWAVELEIALNPDALSAEQILNLLNIAGFACGIGEGRPEKSGQNGQFRIAEEADAKLIDELREASSLAIAAE